MRYLYISLLVFASLPSIVKGQIITTVAGNGTQGYSGDGGQATNAELTNPAEIILDGVGNLYIADDGNHRVRKVNLSGIISTIAGTGTHGYSGDGGPASAAELFDPTGICFDAVGNLYIAEYGNSRIRMINTTEIISTVAGNGAFGFGGDGGQATAAECNGPEGVTFDAQGNLYIADIYNNRIRKVNTAGIISTVVGNGTAGYSGDGGQATAAALYQPQGIAFDATGNLYIADSENNRIRRVNTGGIISTIVGNGTGAFSGDGGQATNAELNDPTGIAFDVTGNLYLSDSENNRVRKVNAAGIISTVAGGGTNIGDGELATVAELLGPCRVTFDAIGNLYFAENSGNRIRKVTNVAAAGIEQVVNINEQVTVYPNPANTSLTLTFSKGEGTAALQITDMLGNTVKQLVIYNSSLLIDVSDLSEGVYNISISGNKAVINKRVIIVR